MQIVSSKRLANSVACSVRNMNTSAKLQASVEDNGENAEWTAGSSRIGALAVKIGMTALWSSAGVRNPCTILQMEDTQVTGHRLKPYTAVQVGCKGKLRKRTHKGLLGHFDRNGVEPKMKTVEFQVSVEGFVPIGSVLKAAHFVPGQYVDVQAKTIGKGYAGAMKRHGFKGLKASHGVSISHRSPGSTGQHQDPGRVFPGKKMAGRMGGINHTVQSLLCLRVDNANNLVYVKGSVPGHDGTFVILKDAIRKRLGREGNKFGVSSLPYPAATERKVEEWKLPEETQLHIF